MKAKQQSAGGRLTRQKTITAGEWVWFDEDEDDNPCAFRRGTVTAIGVAGDDMYNDRERRVVAQYMTGPDARLLAAAKKLLAACEGFDLALHESVAEELGLGDQLSAARTAIYDATGRSR